MKHLIVLFFILLSNVTVADVYFAGDNTNFIKTELNNSMVKFSHCKTITESQASCENLINIRKEEFLKMRLCLAPKMVMHTAEAGVGGFFTVIFGALIPKTFGISALPIVLTAPVAKHGYDSVIKSTRQMSLFSSDASDGDDYITDIMDVEEYITLLNESSYKTMDCDSHGAWEESTGLFEIEMSSNQIRNLKMAEKQ